MGLYAWASARYPAYFKLPKFSFNIFRIGLSGFYFFWFALLGFVAVFGGQNALLDLHILRQAFTNPWLYSALLGHSFLGEHFSPVLYIFLPLLGLLNHPLSYIVLNSLIMVATAWQAGRLARVLTQSEFWAGAIMFLCLNFPYAPNFFRAGFHSEILYPLVVLSWALAAWQRQERHAWIWFGLGMLIDERHALIFLPLLALFMAYKKYTLAQGMLRAALLLLSTLVSLVMVLIFSGGRYPHLQAWSSYGAGLGQIIMGIFIHPADGLMAFFKPPLLILTAWSGGMIFLTPWALGAMIPLWISLASANPNQAQLAGSYAAFILPGCLLALSMGALKCQKWLAQRFPQRSGIWQRTLILALCAWSLPQAWPADLQKFRPSDWPILYGLDRRATVLCQAAVAPLLAHPQRVSIMGVSPLSALPDVVVFQLNATAMPAQHTEFIAWLAQLRNDPRYVLHKEQGGLVIFKKRSFAIRKN
jgi:uncharacterized membrane protein